MFWLEAKYSIPQEFVYQKLYVCSQGLFSVGVISFAYIVFRESRHIKILLSRRGCRTLLLFGRFADVVKPPVNASPEPKKEIIKRMM